MDFVTEKTPAIRALGPLFKLTEVHLWDNSSSEMRESSYFQETHSFGKCDHSNEKGGFVGRSGFVSVPEDLELANEMNDLGLPLSFCTNKEKRNGTFRGKQKGTRKTNQQSPIKVDDDFLLSIKVSAAGSQFPATIKASKVLDQSEMPKHDIIEDLNCLSNLTLERGGSTSSSACNSSQTNELDDNSEIYDLGFDHSLINSCGLKICEFGKAEDTQCTSAIVDDGISGSCLINEVVDHDKKEIEEEVVFACLQDPLAMNHDTDDQLSDLGFVLIHDVDLPLEKTDSATIEKYPKENSADWVPYWDDFYMKTYFYNTKTEESTWDPPLGMEHLLFGSITNKTPSIVVEGTELNNDRTAFCKFDEVQATCHPSAHLSLAEECVNDNGMISEQIDEISGDGSSPEIFDNAQTTKSQKKVKREKINRKLSFSSEVSLDLQGVLQEVTPSISKYWCQRYSLFSRFDQGIIMDEEGWFSVTPEVIAKHHASRCGSGAVIDFFTGVGGNAIQFAQRSKHVIAIDINPYKIEYARHNAAIYGVGDNIDFMVGDSFSLAPTMKADTVFMSPPWGGPDYSKVKKFDIKTMLRPRDGQSLFDIGKRIAPKIAMFLPRNIDINQLAELSLSTTPPWTLEVEKNFLNGRLKGVTAYFFEPSTS